MHVSLPCTSRNQYSPSYPHMLPLALVQQTQKDVPNLFLPDPSTGSDLLIKSSTFSSYWPLGATLLRFARALDSSMEKWEAYVEGRLFTSSRFICNRIEGLKHSREALVKDSDRKQTISRGRTRTRPTERNKHINFTSQFF